MSDRWFKTYVSDVTDLSPVARLLLEEFCVRARYNGNKYCTELSRGLEPGEFYFGRLELSRILKVSEKAVRCGIDCLAKAGRIKVQTRAGHGSIGSISDLSRIKHDLTDEGQQRASKGPAEGPQTNHNHNHKPKERSLSPDSDPKDLQARLHEILKRGYPERLGGSGWMRAVKKLAPQIKSTADMERFRLAVENYRTEQEFAGNIGSKFVKAAENFCSKDVWPDFVVWQPSPEIREKLEHKARLLANNEIDLT